MSEDWTKTDIVLDGESLYYRETNSQFAFVGRLLTIDDYLNDIDLLVEVLNYLIFKRERFIEVFEAVCKHLKCDSNISTSGIFSLTDQLERKKHLKNWMNKAQNNQIMHEEAVPVSLVLRISEEDQISFGRNVLGFGLMLENISDLYCSIIKHFGINNSSILNTGEVVSWLKGHCPLLLKGCLGRFCVSEQQVLESDGQIGWRMPMVKQNQTKYKQAFSHMIDQKSTMKFPFLNDVVFSRKQTSKQMLNVENTASNSHGEMTREPSLNKNDNEATSNKKLLEENRINESFGNSIEIEVENLLEMNMDPHVSITLLQNDDQQQIEDLMDRALNEYDYEYLREPELVIFAEDLLEANFSDYSQKAFKQHDELEQKRKQEEQKKHCEMSLDSNEGMNNKKSNENVMNGVEKKNSNMNRKSVATSTSNGQPRMEELELASLQVLLEQNV